MNITFNKPVRIQKIDYDGIYFSDGSSLVGEHFQDCCEEVYAAWENLQDSGILDLNIEAIKIEELEGIGINLLVTPFINGYSRAYIRYFVPGYNIQNGYYNSNLSLVFEYGNTQVKHDISHCLSEF